MELKETELTPELAAQLLAKPHPKQRRPARQVVQMYARAIKEGRWRLVTDAILVDDEGQMFNGGHRCAAAIEAHRSIPVYIHWGADPALFDVIDVGRRRSAYQFISDTEATARASAARVTLWYERRFEQPLMPRHLAFDMHEIMVEAEERSASFEAMVPHSRTTYEYTGIPVSVSLAAYSIAFGFGLAAEVESFVNGLADPMYLDMGDPARMLAERYRKETHRRRRRQIAEDWTVLVRALNAHLQGRLITKLAMTEQWPRVAETEAEFNKRRRATQDARYNVRRFAGSRTKAAVA